LFCYLISYSEPLYDHVSWRTPDSVHKVPRVPCVSKKCRKQLIKAAWTDLIISLAYKSPKILALKHIDNFTPHLSCVATLPENTLATEIGTSFSCGWMALKRSSLLLQLTTDEFQYSLKFQVGPTDWCVCGTPSYSWTWGH